MKSIEITLSIPDELHQLMEQDRQPGNPLLQQALVETIWRYYRPEAHENRRPGFYGRLPDQGDTGWGDEWASRWSELKAERSARTRRTGEPQPGDAADPPVKKE